MARTFYKEYYDVTVKLTFDLLNIKCADFTLYTLSSILTDIFHLKAMSDCIFSYIYRHSSLLSQILFDRMAYSVLS